MWFSRAGHRQQAAAFNTPRPSAWQGRRHPRRFGPVLELLESRDLPSGLGAAGQLPAAYGQIPLSFEANQGQTDAQVRFLSRGPGYALFLTGTEAVLSLQKPSAAATGQPAAATAGGDVLRLQLVGGNPAAAVFGRDPLPGTSNYLIGNDSRQWHTGVANYGEVAYRGVYPGIDLVYYGNQRQLEYDFVVAPGADPGAIQLRFQGADSVVVDGSGNLVLHTPGGDLIEHAPVIYQDGAGSRQAVGGRFVLEGGDQVDFQVDAYDHSRPLTIDPVLAYSTYLGGNFSDDATAIAVDDAGNAYVTGKTFSTDFPLTPGAFQTDFRGGSSTFFVSALNATGTALVYSTFLGAGGSVFDGVNYASGIAVDSAGDAVVTGQTNFANFPTTPGAFQTTLRGSSNAFVTKLNPTGTGLVYSTFLGGGSDNGRTVVLDSAGNAFVVGTTHSANFPTTPGAYQTTLRGSVNAFVTKLNAAGSGLLYSTYLGTGTEYGEGIAIDGAGNAFVVGDTMSTDFPTTPGAFQTTLRGFGNDFVAKLNAAGSGLVYSTYLGGNGWDVAEAVAVDGAGNAYVTGDTYSSNFPTTPGAFDTHYHNGVNAYDAYVTKLNALGTGLVYSTYLGGSDFDAGWGIVVDGAGDAYVAGDTYSGDFPTTPGAFQTNRRGTFNAYLTEFNAAGSGLVYSTYLGGNSADSANGIAMDAAGDIYLAGSTGSSDFPTTPGAFQTTNHGRSGNAFITKFANPVNVTHLGVTVGTGLVTAGTPVSVTVTALGADGHTVPGYRGTVRFTSSDGRAVLPADYTFSADDNGVHTFMATFKIAGPQSLTATDTVTPSLTGTQTGIVVAPAAADHFRLTAPARRQAGRPFSVTLTALDPFGNVAVRYSGTVNWRTSDPAPGVVLPPAYAFTAADAGVHTFTRGFTLITPGAQTLTATDANGPTGMATVTVKNPGVTDTPDVALGTVQGPVSVAVVPPTPPSKLPARVGERFGPADDGLAEGRHSLRDAPSTTTVHDLIFRDADGTALAAFPDELGDLRWLDLMPE